MRCSTYKQARRHREHQSLPEAYSSIPLGKRDERMGGTCPPTHLPTIVCIRGARFVCLECENRAEFLATVVPLTACHPRDLQVLPGREVRHLHRGIERLFKGERTPLVHLVIECGGCQAAARASGRIRTEYAIQVPGVHLVHSPMEVRLPACVPASRVGIEPFRERQPEVSEATICPDRTLWSDCRNSGSIGTNEHGRGTIDRGYPLQSSETQFVVEVGKELARKEVSQVPATIDFPDEGEP